MTSLKIFTSTNQLYNSPNLSFSNHNLQFRKWNLFVYLLYNKTKVENDCYSTQGKIIIVAKNSTHVLAQSLYAKKCY